MTTIPLDHIDLHDRRFCISYPLENDLLLASIRRLGIIHPLILLDRTPLIVVTGFKRLAMAQKLGFTAVPAILMDLDEREALLYTIHDNLTRDLNLVEKAHTIDKILHTGSADELRETITLLGFQPHNKILTHLSAIASAEVTVKDFIVTHNLAMKNTRYLFGFDTEERGAIINALSRFHVTESMIREALETLSLLKVRTGAIPLVDLAEAVDGKDLEGRLKERTHPSLSALHRKLQGIKQQAALSPDMDIRVDPFFEKEYIDIRIRAKSDEDVAEAVRKLHALIDADLIRSIFDLTKGRIR
ncbi:MAG: Nucleoid occlusion protein [Syntrophorhabdus sp. PtaU1.Bin002]|nr:MAG: Nucleoid occlusion protein [Syntrophorhabdus sp. PtaU1.Bin002]